jgi:NAD(P)H-flavin reductase
MSQHLDRLSIGESVLIKGPQGRFVYNGLGQYDMVKNPGHQTLTLTRVQGPRGHSVATHIGMLAGGTGITPMYQVIRAVLMDPNDTTTISLLFGNIEERDILMRDQLEQFQEKSPRFSVFHTLNNVGNLALFFAFLVILFAGAG